MSKQTRPLPFREQQELVEAARAGVTFQRVSPDAFRQIQELVEAGAPEYSKIEKDALAMLCAGVTDQYRAKEEKQQRRKQRGKLLRWHKRGAA